MPRSVLIDTDPGVDDAMAILMALASPELDVLGLTTVFGNVELDQSTINALRVLEIGGRTELPVVMGAARPLVRALPESGASVHGLDGLGGAFAGSPPPAGRPCEGSAATFIARTALERPGELTIIAIGPLTNLALALRLEPRLATAVRQIVVMVGAAFRRGNATPVAEANAHSDPEAAAIVFSAGWPLAMVGLDVTMRTIADPAYFDELATVDNPRTAFVARIVPHYLRYYRQRYGLDGVATHDPSAVAYAIDPGLFTTESVPVWVETEGRCAGQTIPDRHRDWGEAPEVQVCVEVDAPRVLALVKERLQSPDSAPRRS